jgi:hypothetical protein
MPMTSPTRRRTLDVRESPVLPKLGRRPCMRCDRVWIRDIPICRRQLSRLPLHKSRRAIRTVYDAPPGSPPHTRNVVGSAPTSPTVIPVAEDDGVEWDTGQLADDAKPEVQMFLPMLRVLGKGSFGKVRPTNSCLLRCLVPCSLSQNMLCVCYRLSLCRSDRAKSVEVYSQ